ncbi:hypothetical protein B0H16DRAFT_1743603 [Mycena metata]|uniref:Uncharacterized protein n=1 Tax=Mycena metata TaxID=1033252 RepID=A0AAD7H6K9_9AGAR|nr:hypothetical protein B0H16DRAFT_1743603 [Mycena metata]
MRASLLSSPTTISSCPPRNIQFDKLTGLQPDATGSFGLNARWKSIVHIAP